MTALTGDLNYASLFHIVVIVRAGIFCSESVVLRCIRQLCGILAGRFSCGYRNTVVAGYFQNTLTRNTGNSQFNRTATGQRIRSCGDSDFRRSLNNVKGSRADYLSAYLNGSGSLANIGVISIGNIKAFVNYLIVLSNFNLWLQSRTRISLVFNSGIYEIGVCINYLIPLCVYGIRHIVVDVLADCIRFRASSITGPLLEGVAITSKVSIVNFNNVILLASIIPFWELNLFGLS